MSFAPTTQRAIETPIIAGMHAITPTLESGRTWKFNADPEAVGASLSLRQFSLDWSDEEVVEGGATGNLDYEVEATLEVVTHYGDLPFDRLGEVLGADHFDVNRYFSDRLDTIDGLVNWQPLGREEVDRDSRVYAHRYRVAYMRR